MKKIILMCMFLLSVGSMYAEETKNAELKAYEFNVNANSLVRALNLSKEQSDDLESVHTVFFESMKYAGEMSGESQKNMIKSAIEYDLRNIKEILDAAQYREYLKLLNATLVNRKIKF